MWLSVYACLFVGTLLNHLTASQSFFGEDRSFLEDLFDNRRHTKSKWLSLASSESELLTELSEKSLDPKVRARTIKLFFYSSGLIKTSLFRPSLFHVIKFPNDECFDMSNQSGTCYTPLQVGLRKF